MLIEIGWSIECNKPMTVFQIMNSDNTSNLPALIEGASQRKNTNIFLYKIQSLEKLVPLIQDNSEEFFPA